MGITRNASETAKKKNRISNNNNRIKDLPCNVVDSLCRWWWWWWWCWCGEWCEFWCSCSVDCCSSMVAVDDTIESLALNVRNRYDPCAFISSFTFENTPFRPAVHTNTNNKSNAMILNTANIDDNCCRDRVVIFICVCVSLSPSRCVCLCVFVFIWVFVYLLFVLFFSSVYYSSMFGCIDENFFFLFDVLVFLQWIVYINVCVCFCRFQLRIQFPS